jgi:hypothetical protein
MLGSNGRFEEMIMLRRFLAFLLMLSLAACGGNANVTPEATSASAEATEAVAEVTEASAAALELTAVHETPLAWGGRASFSYPAEWTVRDTSQGNLNGDISIFSPDGYNFGITISNDPSNTERTVENMLNAMNQSSVIQTVERNGHTIYYSDTRLGNGWAAGTYVEGTIFAFTDLVNTRQRELEPMFETAFAILMSVQIIPGE